MQGISDFFSQKTVVITGGTGFVGKCLVEKLLRDCPELEKIYLIIRPKKGETSLERFHCYFNSVAFDRIRDRVKIGFNKLELVEGDIAVDSCGLNEKNLELISSAHVVLHAAAAVSFHLPLAKSVKLNVGGTKNVLDLALRLKNLQAFVYVSTAYLMPWKMLVEERVYPTDLEPLEALKFFQLLPLEWMKKFTPIMTSGRSSYQYSKHLAEKLVESYRDRLPVSIVRPGAILAAWREPFPGWNEADSTLSEYLRNGFSGINRMILIHPHGYFPITPVDITVNTVLGAAWRMAVMPTPECAVYNCIPLEGNKIRFRDVIDWGVEYVQENQPPSLMYYPRTAHSQFFPVLVVVELIFRFIPALVKDALVGVEAGKSSRVDACKRALIITKAFGQFTLDDRHFTTENVTNLGQLMLPKDKRLFPIDIAEIEWKKFIRITARGLQNFSGSNITEASDSKSKGIMARYKHLEWVIPLGVLGFLASACWLLLQVILFLV